MSLSTSLSLLSLSSISLSHIVSHFSPSSLPCPDSIIFSCRKLIVPGAIPTLFLRKLNLRDSTAGTSQTYLLLPLVSNMLVSKASPACPLLHPFSQELVSPEPGLPALRLLPAVWHIPRPQPATLVWNPQVWHTPGSNGVMCVENQGESPDVMSALSGLGKPRGEPQTPSSAVAGGSPLS